MKKEEIRFKKVKWVLTEKKLSFPACVEFWKYKVYRKYGFFWLNNTKCEYVIFPYRWKILKKKLKENKNFHYTQLVGLGCKITY
jgi:hypothetical protein